MQAEDEKQAAAMTTTAAAESERGGCGEAAGGERKRKTTRGRQKIEIKRIERLAARYVCFSKRHTGLIKKAADLVALCGAHVAVVVFSQAGKPFSFGHPSVNAVFGRYLDDLTSSAGGVWAAPPAAAPGEETARQLAPLLHEYRSERERLEKAIEAEASRGKALDAAARAAGVRAATGGEDLRGAGMPELVAMLAALERVQAETVDRMRDAIAEEAMMQQWQCAAAGSGGDGSGGAFSYPGAGAGAFAADGGAASSSSRLGVMDTQTMLMLGGGDVIKQAPTMPLAPMMLPPYLPPPPPLIYGADHDPFAGYGYDLGGGSCCHDAAYEIEGCYGTTATCNFFE
ncbi:unnamed protein product [Urochloa decumbens]|uniref:MADS-box domain-containing protein n=1 Tax=Urochloa decumbens TaxID=240449 RepID=A0ABC9E0N1_9POAL